MLSNPPQPEDADIHDEPDAVVLGDGASSAYVGESAGVELPTAEDSGESDPLQIKRARPSGANEPDAASGVGDLPPPAPPTVAHSSARKRRNFGKLIQTHAAPDECV